MNVKCVKRETHVPRPFWQHAPMPKRKVTTCRLLIGVSDLDYVSVTCTRTRMYNRYTLH